MFYLNISWQTEVDFWKGFLVKCIQLQKGGDGSLIILFLEPCIQQYAGANLYEFMKAEGYIFKEFCELI